MSNYAETASSSTIHPLTSVPCRQPQEHPVPSYAIGPIDPAHLVPLQARLTTGQHLSLPVPARLPHCLLTDPEFKDGYECGYTETDPEEDAWTVPKLINQVYRTLTYERSSLYPTEEPAFYPWTLGFLLGTLTYLAEVDRTLALTGLAHYHYLLTLLPVERTAPWPLFILSHAFCLHNDAVKAYRARVRGYREQGTSFAEAQRLALCS